MKLTLYTTDSSCADIITVRIAHMTMFKDMTPLLRFTSNDEETKFIAACIKHSVLIKVQGHEVSLIPEQNNFQRVRYRFDSDHQPQNV